MAVAGGIVLLVGVVWLLRKKLFRNRGCIKILRRSLEASVRKAASAVGRFRRNVVGLLRNAASAASTVCRYKARDADDVVVLPSAGTVAPDDMRPAPPECAGARQGPPEQEKTPPRPQIGFEEFIRQRDAGLLQPGKRHRP